MIRSLIILAWLLGLATGALAAPPADGLLPITAESRCPVCGMLVAKYPLWQTQVRLSEGGGASFDGVKDMGAFIFAPQAFGAKEGVTITEIAVKDYYSQRWIDGRSAWYVLGSDVLGPMGHELIPFADQAQAETFMRDHKGTRLLAFTEIDDKLIEQLRRGHKMKHHKGMAKP